MDAAATATLIEDAVKKSGLLWVRAAGPGHIAQPVWHIWHEGAIYVLTGGLEQPAPGGLETVDPDDSEARALVTVRGKDSNGRLATFETTVARIPTGSNEWDALVPALQAKRLNLPDGEAAPQRWAIECTLWQLIPTGAVRETVDEPSTDSHAAAPPPSPARSRVPRPLHLRGRPARNRGGH
jgi:hypothetical protein